MKSKTHKTLRNGQFYVDAGFRGTQPVPIDNFFWMTKKGRQVRIGNVGGRVVINNKRKHEWFDDVSSALRRMADILENNN